MAPREDTNHCEAMAGQKVAAPRSSRASVLGRTLRALSNEPNLRRLSGHGLVLLLLGLTSPALAERRLQGLDLDPVVGGGPPFNFGVGSGKPNSPGTCGHFSTYFAA